MSKIGLVHLGESLEAYNEADMARKLRDVYDVFVFNSTWCWSQDGFYYTNGQKVNKEGMLPYSKGDRYVRGGGGDGGGYHRRGYRSRSW